MGFLVPDELIESKVDYIELGDNQVLVIGNEEYKKICRGKNIKIKTIKAKFSRPKWGLFNQYIKNTVSDDLNTGESKMDTLLLRQQKFRVLLEEISEVIDGVESPIVLTEGLFQNINTDIAIALVAGYDDELNKERDAAAEILGLFDELKDKGKDEGEGEGEDEEDETESPEEEKGAEK